MIFPLRIWKRNESNSRSKPRAITLQGGPYKRGGYGEYQNHASMVFMFMYCLRR